MPYFISFLEGVFTFVSPCLLPMVPIYLLYFAGGTQAPEEAQGRAATVRNALGFMLGFTLVFAALGAFAGTLGSLLIRYRTVVNIVSGTVMILFGLNYLGVLKISFLNRVARGAGASAKRGFLPSLLFGMVFSVSWTPCVGAFLGSALLLAAQEASMVQGVVMLLCFSLGLGIPFVASAVLVNQMKTVFAFVKNHYKVINMVSGMLLIVVGLFTMTGYLGLLLARLSTASIGGLA